MGATFWEDMERNCVGGDRWNNSGRRNQPTTFCGRVECFPAARTSACVSIIFKGIVPHVFFDQSNLIFWIVIGCGITRFGKKCGTIPLNPSELAVYCLLGYKYNTCCNRNERRGGRPNSNSLGFSEKEAEKRISKNVWLMEKLLQFHWLNFPPWRHLWKPGLSLIPLFTNCHLSNGCFSILVILVLW